MPKMPEKVLINTEELYKKAISFVNANEEIKRLKKVADPLKEELKESADYGVVDGKGNKVLEIEGSVDGSKGRVILTNTLRVSATLKPNALEAVKAKCSKKVQEQLIETIEVVRDDVLQRMIETGEIDNDLAKELYTTSDSYAFTAKIIK